LIGSHSPPLWSPLRSFTHELILSAETSQKAEAKRTIQTHSLLQVVHPRRPTHPELHRQIKIATTTTPTTTMVGSATATAVVVMAIMVAMATAMAVTPSPILRGRLLLHGGHPGVDLGMRHGLAPLDPVFLATALLC
jgi:hypothetical protein